MMLPKASKGPMDTVAYNTLLCSCRDVMQWAKAFVLSDFMLAKRMSVSREGSKRPFGQDGYG